MDGAWRRPTDSSLRSGTPSLGEVPSGGARAFCLLLRFSKVSRRQGGTLSGRYRRNGYVHNPTVLTVRPPSQASQLPHLDRGASGKCAPIIREQAPSPQIQRRTEVVQISIPRRPQEAVCRPNATPGAALCRRWSWAIPWCETPHTWAACTPSGTPGSAQESAPVSGSGPCARR